MDAATMLRQKASRIWRMQDQIKKVNIRFCLAIQVMIIICRQTFQSCLKKALTILHLATSTRQALCKVCTWLMPDHLSLLAYRKQANMDLFSERLTRIVQRLGSYRLPAANTSILRCACQVILQRMSWKKS